jgi:hypothetical protein
MQALSFLDISNNGLRCGKYLGDKNSYSRTRGQSGPEDNPMNYGVDLGGVIALATAVKECTGPLCKFTFSGDEYGVHLDELKNSKPVVMEAGMTDADFSGKVMGDSGAIMLGAFLPKCK